MRLEIDPDDVQKVSADSRGRVYLGTEFADTDEIEVAVLNADELRARQGNGTDADAPDEAAE